MSPAVLDQPRTLPETVDDGTRREFLAGGLALSLGLAACGGDDGVVGDEPASSFPRTVEHAGGATRIPARPTRVHCARNA